MVAYHVRLGASPASLANLDRLARGEAVASVTGQQPGLLGGPLDEPASLLIPAQIHLVQEEALTVAESQGDLESVGAKCLFQPRHPILASVQRKEVAAVPLNQGCGL